MTCQECSPSRLRLFTKRVRQTASLMVGQPDYDNYLAHWAKFHPDEIPMTRTEFFRNREDRRFGGGVATGGFRCC